MEDIQNDFVPRVQELVTRGSRMVTFDLHDVLLLDEKAIELISELAALCLAHRSSVEVLMIAASLTNTWHRMTYLRNFLLGELTRSNVAIARVCPREPAAVAGVGSA